MTLDYDATWDGQDQSKNHNELLTGEVVLWRNAQWRVTNMFLEAKAEPNLFGPPYHIDIGDIGLSGIIDNVLNKDWVDSRLFLDAYKKACELHGVDPAGLRSRNT